MAHAQLKNIVDLIAKITETPGGKPEIKLMKAIKALNSQMKDLRYAEEIAQAGAIMPIWSILGKSTRVMLQLKVVDCLCILLQHHAAIVALEESAEEMFPVLMEWALGSSMQLRKALPLLTIIVEFLHDGFEVFDRLSEERAKSSGEAEYLHIVERIASATVEGGTLTEDATHTVRLLNVLATKAAAREGGRQLNEYTHKLKQVNIEDALQAIEARFQGELASEGSGRFLDEVQTLKLLCSGADVDIEHWKIDAHLERAQEGSELSRKTKLLENLMGLDGSTAEDALLGLLSEQVKMMFDKMAHTLTQEQQTATEAAFDRERRANAQKYGALHKQLEDHKKQVVQFAEDSQSNMVMEANSAKEAVMREIDHLKSNQQVLVGELEKARMEASQKHYIHENQLMHLFYKTIQLKLNEILLACKVLASGLVAAEDIKSKKSKGFEGFVALAGESVPLPGLKAAATCINLGLKFRRSKIRQKKQIRASALACTVTEMERITELCSRVLAFRYEEQLRQCTHKGAQMFAECNVLRMMDAINNDSHTLVEGEVAERLIQSTLKQKSGWSWDKKQIEHVLDEKKKRGLLLGQRVKWNDQALLAKAGIKTEDGKFFSSPDPLKTKASKYGYRIGTEQEARGLNWVEVKPEKSPYFDRTASDNTRQKRSSIIVPTIEATSDCDSDCDSDLATRSQSAVPTTLALLEVKEVDEEVQEEAQVEKAQVEKAQVEKAQVEEIKDDLPKPNQSGFSETLAMFESASPRNVDASPAYTPTPKRSFSRKKTPRQSRSQSRRGSSVLLSDKLDKLQDDVTEMQKSYQKQITDLSLLVQQQQAMLKAQQDAIDMLMAKLSV